MRLLRRVCVHSERTRKVTLKELVKTAALPERVHTACTSSMASLGACTGQAVVMNLDFLTSSVKVCGSDNVQYVPCENSGSSPPTAENRNLCSLLGALLCLCVRRSSPQLVRAQGALPAACDDRSGAVGKLLTAALE